MSKIHRRKFLQDTMLAGAAVAVGASSHALVGQTPAEVNKETHPKSQGLPEKFKSKIRIGFIGTGLRGMEHVKLALLRDDCEVTAIADPDPHMVAKCLHLFDDRKVARPKVYDKGNFDFENLVQDNDVDAVVIATPWEWHTQQAMAAMKAGKYVATEVRGAFSLDECWQLVHTHEATGTHLMFLENVCYRRDVMAILQMVRENLFGELIHLECGYQHDLRGVKFNDGKTPYNSGVEFGEKAYSEAKWRTIHSVHRNGDLYPTHGIGPIAMLTNINRGNRFLYLNSISSKSRGLHNYIVAHPKGGAQHPNARIKFALGDVVTTFIKTSNGESIVVCHDTNLPRPYSLGFRVQGTRGLWMDINKSIYIEGVTKAHAWEEAQAWLTRYDHPLWRKFGADAKTAGHGGMDFFVFHHFVESAKRNQAPQIDVYDAATWLAITPLSEASIAAGSAPQAFPDFTRGRWMTRPPNFALDDQF